MEYSTQEVGDFKFRIPSRYKVLDIKGKGSYGIVCSAFDTKLKKKVAIKKNVGIFPVKDYNGNILIQGRSEPVQKRILREFKILQHLSDHPYILNLVDVVIPEDYNTFSDVYFISDLMETDLRRIIDSKQEFTEKHTLYSIHSAEILHRDLKPENILINSDCGLKIIDFGLARGLDFKSKKAQMSTNYVQTRWYRAPELLLKSSLVTPQVDMWSVGCIFGELYARKPIFPGASPTDQIGKIIEMMGTPNVEDIEGSKEGVNFVLEHYKNIKGKKLKDVFPYADSKGLDLLQNMLQFNPKKRISAIQALSHPYFDDLYAPDDLEIAEKFNFSFEKDIQTIGCKKILYNSIVEFKKALKKREKLLIDTSYKDLKNTSSTQSPIQDLLQKYKKDVMDETE